MLPFIIVIHDVWIDSIKDESRLKFILTYKKMATEDRVLLAIVLCISELPKDTSINKKPLFLSEVVVSYKKKPRNSRGTNSGANSSVFRRYMRRFSQTLLSRQAFETRIKTTI